jgi:hypothetical protein
MVFPDESRLVPASLRYDAAPPFIGLTLSTLYLLETQPSVQQYIQANPQAHRSIRALSTAIAQAGGRVRDTAPSGGMFDEHMDLFTAEEFWMVDLAADVIAMFAAAGGIDPDKHALVINDLRQLDKTARIYDWKSKVSAAGDGPAEFGELRASTPRHEPAAPSPEDLILENLITGKLVPARARTPEGLVPDDLRYSAVAPFIDLMLAVLGGLGREPVVQQYTEADPDALRALRALSTSVAQAGIRVRDTAKHHDMFAEHMELFTAEEFWVFDLAVDVIAMFTNGGGLTPDRHASLIDELRLLDRDVRRHHWRKQVRKAGDGPAEFRELRAHIPRHEPHPR